MITVTLPLRLSLNLSLRLLNSKCSLFITLLHLVVVSLFQKGDYVVAKSVFFGQLGDLLLLLGRHLSNGVQTGSCDIGIDIGVTEWVGVGTIVLLLLLLLLLLVHTSSEHPLHVGIHLTIGSNDWFPVGQHQSIGMLG